MSTTVPGGTEELKVLGKVRAYPFLIGVIEELEAVQPVLHLKS